MRRLGLASVVGLLTVLAGCKASSPSKMERSVMRWAKHTVSVRNKSERNPPSPNLGKYCCGEGGFFTLLRSVPRNGRSEYGRALRG